MYITEYIALHALKSPPKHIRSPDEDFTYIHTHARRVHTYIFKSSSRCVSAQVSRRLSNLAIGINCQHVKATHRYGIHYGAFIYRRIPGTTEAAYHSRDLFLSGKATVYNTTNILGDADARF